MSTERLLQIIYNSFSILDPFEARAAEELQRRCICACNACEHVRHREHKHAHDASGKMVVDERNCIK
jgi:hypothetical protein